MTRRSLIIAGGALVALVVLVPLNGIVWLSALATASLVAAFWDRGHGPIERALRALVSGTAACLAVWLALHSGWRAEPTGFAIAAVLLIAARLFWTARSGKVTGPPALASPS